LVFFLEGSADALLVFVRRFEAVAPHSRYVLLSEAGLGGLLADPPRIERDGAAWTVSFQWQPDAPRRSASRLAGMSRQTGMMISGEEYWKQCFETVLSRPPRTWFADMEGGSHLSELYEGLRGSTWFEHLIKCELIRLACIPAPPSLGSRTPEHPPFACVRQILGVQVPDTTLTDEKLQVQVDFDLEDYGHWAGELNLFIYSQDALRKERAKASWMVENMRRAESGERVLPSLIPPEGWNIEDGFPG
jgi:hypothetical protein